MSERVGKSDYDVGYSKPPDGSRFRKGQSGNPKGRPKGRKKTLPYDNVLGQMVTVCEDGVERRVTAAEAFLLYMTKRGLEGDGSAARAAMVAIEEARVARGARTTHSQEILEIVFVDTGSVNGCLTTLGMGRKLDRFRTTARIKLEPWLVRRAVDRLGDRRLTLEEQEKVFSATRTPHKVNWPDWWRVTK